MDLYEEKDEIVVKAELPGMEKDNIEVNLADHTLTIKGEKKKEAEVKEENYYRSERFHGSFLRTLELPKTSMGISKSLFQGWDLGSEAAEDRRGQTERSQSEGGLIFVVTGR